MDLPFPKRVSCCYCLRFCDQKWYFIEQNSAKDPREQDPHLSYPLCISKTKHQSVAQNGRSINILPHPFIFHWKPNVTCPDTLSLHISSSVHLLQPHLSACCYSNTPSTTPAQGLCVDSACRHHVAHSLNPCRSLFNQGSIPEQHIWKTRASHTKLPSIPSPCLILSGTDPFPGQYLLICSLSPPPTIMWASWGQVLWFAHCKSSETIWHRH